MSKDGKRVSLYAALGSILSAYALYVEHKMAHLPPDEEFTALCDIDAIGASCSKVFQLPEGRMLSYFGLIPGGSILDVPNAALGLAYYTLWFSLLSPFFPKSIRLVVASLAMSSSVFLATRLVLLSELCVLCWSTHIINARLWWDAFSSVRHPSSEGHNLGTDRGSAKIKRV